MVSTFKLSTTVLNEEVWLVRFVCADSCARHGAFSAKCAARPRWSSRSSWTQWCAASAAAAASTGRAGRRRRPEAIPARAASASTGARHPTRPRKTRQDQVSNQLQGQWKRLENSVTELAFLVMSIDMLPPLNSRKKTNLNTTRTWLHFAKWKRLWKAELPTKELKE